MTMAHKVDILILGSGIAGMSTAFWCQNLAPSSKITLIDTAHSHEDHSSHRNAGIYRQSEANSRLVKWANQTPKLWATVLHEKFLHKAQDTPQIFDHCGVLYQAEHLNALAPLAQNLNTLGVEYQFFDNAKPQTKSREHALWVPSDGTLQSSLLNRTLFRSLESMIHQGDIETVEGADEGWRVTLQSRGRTKIMKARRLVIASGSLASSHAAKFGHKLEVQPRKRHLFHLKFNCTIASLFSKYEIRHTRDGPARSTAQERPPVVWRVDHNAEAYLRPLNQHEALACVCDSQDTHPTDLTTSLSWQHDAYPIFAQRLFPPPPHRVLRSWAGLRSFVEKGPLFSCDENHPNLFWAVALGGHGMSIGFAAGRELAEQIVSS